jgi:hypothetical protein
VIIKYWVFAGDFSREDKTGKLSDIPRAETFIGEDIGCPVSKNLSSINETCECFILRSKLGYDNNFTGH